MNAFRTLTWARRELPRLLPLMRDPRVPTWSKVAATAAAALVVSPLDLLGDIPILGVVDDAALLLLLTHFFVRYADRMRVPARAGARAAR